MSLKRNLAVLFTAHAILGCQMPVNVVLGGLAGASLADNRALATLPLSIIVLISMFVAPLASLIMGRWGRRAGFQIGAAAGAAGGALATLALFADSFGLLLLGAACSGVFQAFQGFVRFAASDAVDAAMKPRAISWVLAAGLVSALAGPEIVRWLGDAFAPVPYAGAYATIVGLNLVGGVIVSFLRIPPPPRRAPGTARERPLGDVLRQPKLVAAVLCAMFSYAVMSLVMTSTSLAMTDQGYTANHAADVVRWHVFAMFAPSFFTGHLISRFGHVRVILTGLGFLATCAAIALTGFDIHQFYLALIALGIGWNFGFIGATSLLATTHTVEEQAFVQGVNDFLVFGLVAIASFSSGALLDSFGWRAVQYAALPAVAVAAVGLLLLARPHKSVPTSGHKAFSASSLPAGRCHAEPVAETAAASDKGL